MREQLESMRKELSEVIGINRSLLGRVNGTGANDTPTLDRESLGKKLDGGLKHGN